MHTLLMLSLLVYNHYYDGFSRKEIRQMANWAHWVCAASQARPQFSFIVVNWLEKASEAEHVQNVSVWLVFKCKALLFLFLWFLLR